MQATKEHTSRPQTGLRPKKFSGGSLVANSAIASIGAGAATVAATGLVLPAIAAAVGGAIVGYTITNEIPKNGDK